MANAYNKFLVTSAGTYRTDRELQNIIYNLNKEIMKVEGASQSGLIRAVAKIHEETEKGSVKVPIDLGNLRHSWFYVTASARIIAGGSTHKLISEHTGKFVGKNAGRLAAEHAAIKTEMTGKAKSFAAQYKGPFVIAGYSANYALWVHEMMGAKFKRRGAGPKWFEIAIKSKQAEILKIIQSNAKIK
jgi:hypothetical protein